MPLPPLPSSLGHQVTTRTFSLLEMVAREWGSSFRAPNHGAYVFSNGRKFDATDIGSTGFYLSGDGGTLLDESGAPFVDELNADPLIVG